MQIMIIGATFLVGVVLAGVAVVALFRKRVAGGEGSLEIAGIKLSGRGSHVLFLLVGAVLMIAGYGWAITDASRQREATRADDETRRRKTTEARATEVDASLGMQLELNAELTKHIPPPKLEELRRARPELFSGRIARLPPGAFDAARRLDGGTGSGGR